MAAPYKRLGPESKCPACGWRIDADAYRCPKCLIYFCYKCRKRVQKDDEQFQCANQKCDCYGKLLCSACTVMVPVMGTERQTTKSGVGRAVFVIAAALCLGSCSLTVGVIQFWAIPLGIIVGYFAFVAASAIAKELGFVMDDEFKEVEAQIGEHRSCIQCRQPLEDLDE